MQPCLQTCVRIRCSPRQYAVPWPANQRICPISVWLEVQGGFRAVCSEQPRCSFDGLTSSTPTAGPAIAECCFLRHTGCQEGRQGTCNIASFANTFLGASVNIVRLSLEIGLLLQLPTDIEVQTLGDDGNKVRVTFGDIIKGKKVTCASSVIS